MSSLQRGLAILEALVDSELEVGLSELARTLDMEKSGVYRLLMVLAAAGYVVQDATSKKYRPSSKLVRMGSDVLARIDLRDTCRPFLAQLVERTGYTAHLAALAEGSWQQVVFLDQAARSSAAILVNLGVGRVAPSHCSATGKVILAYQPEEPWMSSEGEFPRFTPNTHATRECLRQDLEQIRVRGYAVDNEEYREGLRCLAAPIRNHTGSVIASIGVSGLASSLRAEDIPDLARLVSETASQVSAALGFTAQGHVEPARLPRHAADSERPEPADVLRRE
jgi:IclR family transcriptional regulator, KDG regulon repressor